MTNEDYLRQIEAYRIQFERLVEIAEAREARFQTLKIELDALKVKYDYLEQKFLRLLAIQKPLQ